MKKGDFKRIYMIRGAKGYAMTTNKKTARRLMKEFPGATCRALRWESWRECSWDVPTFWLVSHEVTL